MKSLHVLTAGRSRGGQQSHPEQSEGSLPNLIQHKETGINEKASPESIGKAFLY